jgi:hypothetical protein
MIIYLFLSLIRLHGRAFGDSFLMLYLQDWNWRKERPNYLWLCTEWPFERLTGTDRCKSDCHCDVASRPARIPISIELVQLSVWPSYCWQSHSFFLLPSKTQRIVQNEQNHSLSSWRGLFDRTQASLVHCCHRILTSSNRCKSVVVFGCKIRGVVKFVISKFQ